MSIMKIKKMIIILVIFVLMNVVISDKSESSEINIIYNDQQIKEANSNNNSRNVDIVFLVDNTGSMGGEIDVVIKNLSNIIENISNLALLTGKVRYGAIKYQDYEDVYLSEKIDLTENVNSVTSFINGMRADGGGDFPEAAAEAFRQASEMSWNADSIKLVFWIADAPPHPSKLISLGPLDSEKSISNYINNFNSARNNNNQLTWKGEVIKLQESGIIIHSILVRNDSSTREVMSFIARETKGMVISLNSSSTITPLIVNLVAEGLDRDRISNYINKILQNNKNEMNLLNLKQKEDFLLNEVNKLALKGLKMRLVTLPQKENQFDSNIDVKLEFQDLDYFNIKDSLDRIKPCIKYNIFCDYTPEITPKSGIILDGNNSLLLEATKVDIQIIDTLTNVSIVQEFKNNFNKEVNGEYIFPLPLDSSVYEFYADVNQKRLFGRVFTKSKANKLYQMAVQSGNQAFLLSQENNNIYKVNLGNIPANSSVKISFKFSYNLTDNFGKYQLIYPIHAFPDEKSTNCTISCTIVSTNNEIVDLTTSGNTSELTLNKATINYSGLLNKDFNIEYTLKKVINKENSIIISSFNNKEYSEKFLGVKDNFSNTEEYPFYSIRGEFINSNNKSINCPDYYIYVDSSKSLDFNNQQKNDILNSLTKSIKQEENCSSKIKIISFDSKCNVSKDEAINQMSTNKVEINKTTSGSYLIPCLKEINFKSEKIRVVVISDFFISDSYELINLFEQSFKSHNSFRLGLVGIGNRINRDLLKRLSLSTKVKFLEILSSSNVSDSYIGKWLKMLLLDEKNISLTIKNDSDKIVYSKNDKDLLSDQKFMCNDDLISFDKFIFNCLIDKKEFSINDIKKFKFLLNDKQIEVKDLIDNSSISNNTLDILVARNILSDAERIYDDFTNFGKSQLANYIQPQQNQNENIYSSSYINNQPTIKLKHLIEKIGLSYRLVSQFTSFLAVDDEFIKKNEKILNEEEKEEIRDINFQTNSTMISYDDMDMSVNSVPVDLGIKEESKSLSYSAGAPSTSVGSLSTKSPVMESIYLADVKVEAEGKINFISVNLVLLLSLLIMFII